MRSAGLPKAPPPWPFFADPSRACRDTDGNVFFPVRGQSAGPAKRLCNTCPVRDDCREWAIRFEPNGVWGGMSAEERSEERRRRAGTRTRRCETCRRTYAARTEYQRACGPLCAAKLTKRGAA